MSLLKKLNMTQQTIDPIKYFDKASEGWDALGIDQGAAAYDALIKYGKAAAKSLPKPKGFYERLTSATSALGGVFRPALHATTSSLTKAGEYIIDSGKGTLAAGEQFIDAYAMSQSLTKVQETYKTFTGKTTKDREERVKKEEETAKRNLFGRLAGTVKTTMQNAKEYGKLENLATAITQGGIMTSPLMAYALMNGDIQTYKRMIPERDEKPWLEFVKNGRRYTFDKMEDFFTMMNVMQNKAAYEAFTSMYEEQEYQAREARKAQTETQEKDITSDVEVGRTPYERAEPKKEGWVVAIPKDKLLPVKAESSSQEGKYMPANTKNRRDPNKRYVALYLDKADLDKAKAGDNI